MNELTTMTSAEAEEAGISKATFLRLCESGALDDGGRLELVEGKIERMAPAGFEHGRYQIDVGALLRAAYAGTPFVAAGDLGAETGSRSVRAPDVAVVRENAPRTGWLGGNHILLAVEIASSTLRRDLAEKPAEYAAIGIPHYWVLDLQARAIHVMTDPVEGGYASRQVVRFGEPLAVPETDRTITIA